jgi:hypothetical protein
MDCTCTIDVDIAECAERYWIKMRTAREEHKCDECGEPIMPGQTYENAKLFGDGRFAVYKTCNICKEIRNCYFCSWMYTNIWEDLYEELVYQDDFNLCMLDNLSPEARAVMIDYIDNIMEKRDEREKRNSRAAGGTP